jgi:hypothetical protein
MISVPDPNRTAYGRPGYELAELYDADIATNDALGYATRRIDLAPSASRFTFGAVTDFGGTNNPLGTAEVALGAGWRGPYLTWRYPTFTDNWGRPWEINVEHEKRPTGYPPRRATPSAPATKSAASGPSAATVLTKPKTKTRRTPIRTTFRRTPFHPTRCSPH